MPAIADQTRIDLPAISPQNFPIICTLAQCRGGFMDISHKCLILSPEETVKVEFILFLEFAFSQQKPILSHFVTRSWQFLDGRCLKCWVSRVAVIVLVTLLLQHLQYCLHTALHKCHNTDKYNDAWHLEQECVWLCQGSHSHQQVTFNQLHQVYW